MSVPAFTVAGLRARFLARPEAVLDVVDEVLTRRAVDAAHECLAATVPADALRAAGRALLDRCPDPSRLPLWGVPVTVSDLFDVAGLATAAGVPAFAFVAEFDAVAVARLSAAGALVVGKTGVPPLGLGASPAPGIALAEGVAALAISAGCGVRARGGLVHLSVAGEAADLDGVVVAADDGLDVLAADVDGALAAAAVLTDDRHSRVPEPSGRLAACGVGLAPLAALRAAGRTVVALDVPEIAALAALADSAAVLAGRLGDVAAFLAEDGTGLDAHLSARLAAALRTPAGEVHAARARLAGVRARLANRLAGFDALILPGDAPAPRATACGFVTLTLDVPTPDGGASPLALLAPQPRLGALAAVASSLSAILGAPTGHGSLPAA